MHLETVVVSPFPFVTASRGIGKPGHKVQPPTQYKGHKVQIPTKPKGHKVQMTDIRKHKLRKVQTPCIHHVIGKERPPTKHKGSCGKKDKTTQTIHRKTKPDGQTQRNKHTPYGPYNLPHMVLSTKQGPDNA